MTSRVRTEPATEPRTAPDAAPGRSLAGFLAGVTLSDLADRGWLVALAYTAVTTQTPLVATLVIAAGTVPRALLVLIGGTVADRLPTRRLMIGADLARAAALAGALAALSLPTVPLLAVLVGVSVVLGMADAVHLPAVGTMPRQLASGDGLIRVTGLRQIGSRLANLVGPSLAGLALAAVALEGTVALLVLPFLLAAACIALVRPQHRQQAAPPQSVVASIRDVVAHLRVERTSGHLVLALVGLNFFVTPVVSVGVALRTSQQGWGPTVLGLLLGAIGLGAIAATVLTLRRRVRHPLRTALLALVVQGVALTLVGWAPLPVVALAMTAVGVTSGVASPLLAGTVQAVVEPAYLGRVYSLVALADDGVMPLALVGFGALVGLAGLGPTVVACGLGMAALMGLALARRTLRDLTLA